MLQLLGHCPEGKTVQADLELKDGIYPLGPVTGVPTIAGVACKFFEWPGHLRQKSHCNNQVLKKYLDNASPTRANHHWSPVSKVHIYLSKS